MNNRLKIGQEVLIRGYVDEIRKDTIIIQNDGGYFGTVQEEISVKQEPCEDCVSRQTAIAHAVPLNLFGREVMMVSVSELENLPSAQPEIMYYPQVDGVTASIIAQPEITNEEIRFALKQLGADMRGKQDDSF